MLTKKGESYPMSDKLKVISYGERTPNKRVNTNKRMNTNKRANTKKKRRRKRIRKIKIGLLVVCLLICIAIGCNYVWGLFHGNSFVLYEKISRTIENLLVSDEEVSRTIENASDQTLTEPEECIDLEIQKNLEDLAKTSEEYREIYDNMNRYPENLLAALCSNPEMLEFVSGYLEADSSTTGKLTSEEQQESFPLLVQWDKRWGYIDYGDSCIGLAGCAPTCLSMVVLALTGDKDATPDKVAAYAQQEGYYIQGTGTSWSLMTEGAQYFGIEGSELCLDESTVIGELQSGHPIICSMRPGDFTTQGHIIVLVGVQDGKIIVNDPNSRKRSSVLWDYATLSRQIKNLRVYQ